MDRVVTSVSPGSEMVSTVALAQNKRVVGAILAPGAMFPIFMKPRTGVLGFMKHRTPMR